MFNAIVYSSLWHHLNLTESLMAMTHHCHIVGIITHLTTSIILMLKLHINFLHPQYTQHRNDGLDLAATAPRQHAAKITTHLASLFRNLTQASHQSLAGVSSLAPDFHIFFPIHCAAGRPPATGEPTPRSPVPHWCRTRRDKLWCTRPMAGNRGAPA